MTSDRRYVCHFLNCRGYATKDASNFRKHLRMHKGIKRAQRTVCHKRFRDRASLKKHMTVDTAAMPGGSSQYCGTGHSTKSNRLKHEDRCCRVWFHAFGYVAFNFMCTQNDDLCSICSDNLVIETKRGTVAELLPCHKFHESCARRWMEVSNDIAHPPCRWQNCILRNVSTPRRVLFVVEKSRPFKTDRKAKQRIFQQ